MVKAVRLKGFLLFPSVAAVIIGAEPVKVRYAPADGETFVVASTVTRTSTIGEKGPKTDVSKTKSRIVAHRTDEGFENAVTVLSARFEHEGHAIGSPLFTAMADLELTYRLDADGRLLAVTGYEKLADALKAKFPPAISQAMAPLLNYRSIRLRDEAEYRERYEEFIGKTFTPGAARASTKAYALPYGGTIPVYVITKVGSLKSYGRRRRLELQQTYSSDAEMLAASRGTFDEGALPAAANNVTAALPGNYTTASVDGSGEIVIEPDTLFVVSRNSSTDIELEISQPVKGPLRVSMREVREFTSERETASAP